MLNNKFGETVDTTETPTCYEKFTKSKPFKPSFITIVLYYTYEGDSAIVRIM